MIKVKGMFKNYLGVLTFDGDVIEIFGFRHQPNSERIHIDQVKTILKEPNGLSIVYDMGLIAVNCTEGCENMNEFIEALVSASPNPELEVK